MTILQRVSIGTTPENVTTVTLTKNSSEKFCVLLNGYCISIFKDELEGELQLRNMVVSLLRKSS